MRLYPRNIKVQQVQVHTEKSGAELHQIVFPEEIVANTVQPECKTLGVFLVSSLHQKKLYMMDKDIDVVYKGMCIMS